MNIQAAGQSQIDLLIDDCNKAEEKLFRTIADNCKLRSDNKFGNEQLESVQKNLNDCKQHIRTLEERNQKYDDTIAYHESVNKSLRTELLDMMAQHSNAESHCSTLELQRLNLLQAKKIGDVENEALKRQLSIQNVLETANDLAMVSFEERVITEELLKSETKRCNDLKRKISEMEEGAKAKRQKRCTIM